MGVAYQLAAVKMTRAAFQKLPFRDDANSHDPAKTYRTRGGGYHEDFFKWVPYPKDEQIDAPGEWHRGPVEFTD